MRKYIIGAFLLCSMIYPFCAYSQNYMDRSAKNAILPAARVDLGLGGSPVDICAQTGVVCDGTTDDSAAVQTFFNGLSDGSQATVGQGKNTYFASAVNVPAGITFDLGVSSPGIPASGSYDRTTILGGRIFLSNSATITLGGVGTGRAKLRNAYVVNTNLPAKPATQAAALTAIAAYAGTAISVSSGQSDWEVTNVLVVGFTTCMSNSVGGSGGRGYLDHFKGDCTNGYISANSGDVDIGIGNEFGNFFASGIADDGVQLVTNGTTASGNAVLHFASGPSVNVKVGQYVFDLTNFSLIPAGAKVLSIDTGAHTVTLDANAAGAGVGNGDTVIFGGYLAEYRSGTCFAAYASAGTMIAPACVGFQTGVDIYGNGEVIYNPTFISGHIDSFYYFQTAGYITKGIRLRGSVDDAQFVGTRVVNNGIGISAEGGGSICTSFYTSIYTSNNQKDLVAATPCAGGVVNSWLTGSQNISTTQITLGASTGTWNDVGNNYQGIPSTRFSIDSSVNYCRRGSSALNVPLPDLCGLVTTWTPALNFGGAATGITYAGGGQLGYYSQSGKMVTAQFYLNLTSKGSATGSATVSGLPIASYNGGYSGCLVTFTAAVSGASGLFGLVVNNSQTINLDLPGATGIAVSADTNYTNTSIVAGTCSYLVN